MTRSPAFHVRAAPALHRLGDRPLVQAFLQLTRDPRIRTSPQTAFGAFESKIERQLDSETERREWGTGLRELLGLVATLTAEECAKGARRAEARLSLERARLARNPQGATLLRFLDDADRRTPGAVLLGVLNPADHGLPTLTAQACLSQLVGVRGERRAEGLLSATSHVYEAAYQPYLQALSRIAHPARRNGPPEGGALLRELGAVATSFPGLVVPNCNRMRNAAAHRRSKYLVDSHALALHDRNGWREVVPVPELHKRVTAMITMAGTLFPRAMSVFVLAAVKPTIYVLPQLARAAIAEDATAWSAAGQEFENCFAEVRRLRVAAR